MPILSKIKNKEHIIWDWNGTILDDVQHAVDSMNVLLTQQQLPPLNVDQHRQLFEFPVKNYYDQLGFDYSIRSFEELCHDYVDLFMQGVFDCNTVPGIEQTLSEIKTANKAQSLLSATDQPNLDKMISQFGLQHYFDYIYGIKDKYAASKVDRGHELIKNSSFTSQQTLLIGDTLHDLEVADELGVDVILVTHGHQCKDKLSQKHDQIVSL